MYSPSGREPTAYWRAPAFRRGLESAVFKKMNGGGPFRGGAGAETRTPNLMITRHLLYQLELRQHIGGRHCSNQLKLPAPSGARRDSNPHLWPPVHKVRFSRIPTLKGNRRFLSLLIMESHTEHYRSNSMRCSMAFERRVLRRPAVVGPLQAINPVCRSVLIVCRRL